MAAVASSTHVPLLKLPEASCPLPSETRSQMHSHITDMTVHQIIANKRGAQLTAFLAKPENPIDEKMLGAVERQLERIKNHFANLAQLTQWIRTAPVLAECESILSEYRGLTQATGSSSSRFLETIQTRRLFDQLPDETRSLKLQLLFEKSKSQLLETTQIQNSLNKTLKERAIQSYCSSYYKEKDVKKEIKAVTGQEVMGPVAASCRVTRESVERVIDRVSRQQKLESKDNRVIEAVIDWLHGREDLYRHDNRCARSDYREIYENDSAKLLKGLKICLGVLYDSKRAKAEHKRVVT